MAVREGFEPSVRVSTDSRLAGGPVRPLQHLTEWDRYCTYSPVTCKVLPNLGSDPGLVRHGGMAEWSKALVLKTSEVQVSKGSNPFPSASNSSNELLLSLVVPVRLIDQDTARRRVPAEGPTAAMSPGPLRCGAGSAFSDM